MFGSGSKRGMEKHFGILNVLTKLDENVYCHMKIVFKPEDESKLTIGDVEENRYFVDKRGYLCLTFDNHTPKNGTATIMNIANEEGLPVAFTEEVDIDCSIRRILPEVERIEF
jgi:hypothetical protein